MRAAAGLWRRACVLDGPENVIRRLEILSVYRDEWFSRKILRPFGHLIGRSV